MIGTHEETAYLGEVRRVSVVAAWSPRRAGVVRLTARGSDERIDVAPEELEGLIELLELARVHAVRRGVIEGAKTIRVDVPRDAARVRADARREEKQIRRTA